MNIDKIRRDFPIFQKRSGMAYLDNAATTQKPRSVIQTLIHFYENDNFNVHRSVYTPAQSTTDRYEQVRQKVSAFLNGQDSQSVIFTRGTTASINDVAFGYVQDHLQPGDELVVSIMEHHSNLLPWQRLAKKRRAKLRYLPVVKGGYLNLNQAKQIINPRTALVALTGVSNVLGVINPLQQISKIAHDNHALFLLDAAQMAPEVRIDVKRMQPDFVAFSGHKMLGPTGIGVLYIDPHLIQHVKPWQLGGEMIQKVTTHRFSYAGIPQRFEAGTPNIAGVIGLGSAIDYLNQLSMPWIQKRCAKLGQYLFNQLSRLKRVVVYGPQNRSTGIVSFNICGIHPHDVATALDLRQIYVRAGQHCAQPLVKQVLKTGATLRASLYFYNTKSECDRLATALEKIVRFFYAA